MKLVSSNPSVSAALSLFTAFALSACVQEPAPGEESTQDTEAVDDDDDSLSGTGQTTGDPMPDPTTGGGTTTGADAGTDTEDECTFIDCTEDTDGPAPECSLWEQDCPDGEKCQPWANDGGTAWNASKCVPLTDQPGQPGDSCTVEGSGVTGFDSCDIASMCWNVDGETNTGTCVPFCTGSEANPVCDDPSASCVIANDGFLILCLPQCDPLLQDCPDGEACYPADQGFVCAPVATQDGSYGAPCEFTNACAPGLLCAGAQAVPGCVGSMGCCTEFCDLSQPQPSEVCSGLAGGQECVAAFAEGEAPPDYEDVGFCTLPE